MASERADRAIFCRKEEEARIRYTIKRIRSYGVQVPESTTPSKAHKSRGNVPCVDISGQFHAPAAVT